MNAGNVLWRLEHWEPLAVCISPKGGSQQVAERAHWLAWTLEEALGSMKCFSLENQQRFRILGAS